MDLSCAIDVCTNLPSYDLFFRVRRPSDELTELNELRPRSASLQKRKNYSELRQERIDRIHKAGASGRMLVPAVFQ